jgi:GABA(A) receptor-associated protein
MPFFTKPNEAESPCFSEIAPLEKRKLEAQKIFRKYGDSRIPVIVERSASSAKTVPLLDKSKYLVPRDMGFGQFIHIIRKRIKLAPNQAIFLYVNNVLPASSVTMRELYDQHKAQDDFLYAVYAGETTFGDTFPIFQQF